MGEPEVVVGHRSFSFQVRALQWIVEPNTNIEPQ